MKFVYIFSFQPIRISHQLAGYDVAKPTTMAICMENQYTALVETVWGA